MRLIFSSRKHDVGGPAIFVDRDGVINLRRAGSYVLHWSQFEFTPGIAPALREITNLHLPLIVVSNQAAVGRGLLDDVTLEDITRRMHRALQDEGAFIDAVYYCTHRREDCCSCRKPQPGLLRQAAVDFDFDLSRSVFIGDAETDVEAARAAGCHPVLFGPGLAASSTFGEWMRDTPIAPTATELFRVTTDTLESASGDQLVSQVRRNEH